MLSVNCTATQTHAPSETTVDTTAQTTISSFSASAAKCRRSRVRRFYALLIAYMYRLARLCVCVCVCYALKSGAHECVRARSSECTCALMSFVPERMRTAVVNPLHLSQSSLINYNHNCEHSRLFQCDRRNKTTVHHQHGTHCMRCAIIMLCIWATFVCVFVNSLTVRCRNV